MSEISPRLFETDRDRRNCPWVPIVPEDIEEIVEAEGIFQLEDEGLVLGRLCG